jgi:hypothetical protein
MTTQASRSKLALPILKLDCKQRGVVYLGRFVWVAVGAIGIIAGGVAAYVFGNSRADVGGLLDAGALGLFVAGPVACAISCRVVARNDIGVVSIVNVWTVSNLRYAEIADVSGDNGLVVRLWNGREVRSTAFGASLFSGLFGDRQATKISESLSSAIKAPLARGAIVAGRLGRSPRWGALVEIVGCGAAYFLLAVVGRSARL